MHATKITNVYRDADTNKLQQELNDLKKTMTDISNRLQEHDERLTELESRVDFLKTIRRVEIPDIMERLTTLEKKDRFEETEEEEQHEQQNNTEADNARPQKRTKTSTGTELPAEINDTDRLSAIYQKPVLITFPENTTTRRGNIYQ